jgi:transcriptional regulator with XRE-family HTH domain
MCVKERRKALGWDRQELADRAGLLKSVVAMVERGAWSESDALERVATVIGRAEAGEPDPRLPPVQAPGEG